MADNLLDVCLPEKMRFQDYGNHIEIKRTWFSLKFIPLLLFAIVWDGFLVYRK